MSKDKLDTNTFYVSSPSNVLGLLSNDYIFYPNEQFDFEEANRVTEKSDMFDNPSNADKKYVSVMHYIFGRQLKNQVFSKTGSVHAFTEFSTAIADDFLKAGYVYLNSLINMGKEYTSATFESDKIKTYYLDVKSRNESLFERVISLINSRYKYLKYAGTENDRRVMLEEYRQQDIDFLKEYKYRNYDFMTLKDKDKFFNNEEQLGLPEVRVNEKTYKNIGTFICRYVRENVYAVPRDTTTEWNYMWDFTISKLYNEIEVLSKRFTTIGLISKFEKIQNKNVFKFALKTIGPFKSVQYIMNDYDSQQIFLKPLLRRIVEISGSTIDEYRKSVLFAKINPIMGASVYDSSYADYERRHSIKTVDLIKLGDEYPKGTVPYSTLLNCENRRCDDNSLIKRLVDQRYVETVRVRSILDKILNFGAENTMSYLDVYRWFMNGKGIMVDVKYSNPENIQYIIRVYVESNPTAQMFISFEDYDLYNPNDKFFNTKTTEIRQIIEHISLKSMIVFQYMCFNLSGDSTLLDMLTAHTEQFAKMGNNLQNTFDNSRIFKSTEFTAVKNVENIINEFSGKLGYAFKSDDYNKYMTYTAKQIVYSKQVSRDSKNPDALFNRREAEHPQYTDILVENFAAPVTKDACGCGTTSEKKTETETDIKYPEFVYNITS
jgi:hypothetical protein